MKFSSMRYLLREGFRNIWQNRYMAIAAIGVLVSCLLLTGGAYMVFENINNAFDWVYGQNVVVVYAEDGANSTTLTVLRQEIEKIANVETVTFMSKEDTLAKYADSIPKETFEDMTGENNPLPDSFIVTFTDLNKFDATMMQLEKLDHVDDISYNGEIAKTLANVRQIVMVIGGWIIVILLLVSLFIIINTIKLTVYNRRLEIYIMKSVGATNAFIRIPFVVEGIVLGLLAGLIGYGILLYIYTKLTGIVVIGMFSLIPFVRVWWILLIGFVAAGVLTGAVGSAISMSKYLREEASIHE